MTYSPPKLEFESKEEFRRVCQQLSARLGYLNRTKMGESAFVIAMHNLLTQAGRVFDEHLEDEATAKAFGDGYTKGTIARDDHAVALHALMFPSKD